MSEIWIGVVALILLGICLGLSRNYLISFFAFCLAVLSLLGGSFMGGFEQIFTDGIYGLIQTPDRAAMVAFIPLYCGYVGSMEYGGPIKGFTAYMADHGKKTAASVQFRSWLASVGAFFSDLGSPGIVGALFREKYDEVGISRERLALMINLTAVPVCSMIPLVGWGLFAIGILHASLEVLDLSESPLVLFIQSIPYFCFSFLAMLTPLLLVRQKRGAGLLGQADALAQTETEAYQKERKEFLVEIELARENGRGRTLALSLVVMFMMLYLFFSSKISSFGEIETLEVETYMVGLGISFITASLAVMTFTWIGREKSFMKSYRLYSDMFKRTLSVTGIMVMAWLYVEVVWETDIYQTIGSWAGQPEGGLLVFFVLPLVFLLAVGLSSLTGSAWGTYAVTIPLGMVLCQAMGLSLCAGIGAAVSGSVYGDISASNSHAMHYSAESAGVDPHVFEKVQGPYLRAMGLSCILAYGLGALFDRWYLYLAIAVVAYVAILFGMGKRAKS
ncbi:MAG: hypothetical protein HFE73_03560 [Firmicutes bacterium]|nr:hypothetical protein [Bacillota bacterium]